jgi:hypothetical protein
VRGRRQSVVLRCHKRGALTDPRIDDELAGLPLKMAEHGCHRHARARDDRRGVRVDQVGQLITVAAVKWPHLD